MKAKLMIWCELCKPTKPYKTIKGLRKHLDKKHPPLKIEWHSTIPNTIYYS